MRIAATAARARWWRSDRAGARARSCLVDILLVGSLFAGARAAAAEPPALDIQPSLGRSPLAAVGTWSLTGAMQHARALHTATVLPNGKVLALGGVPQTMANPLATAELYDPVSATWALAAALPSARFGHSAMLLQNGLALMAGGVTMNGGDPVAAAALYNPSTDSWAATGGFGAGYLATVEEFDPAGNGGGGSWLPTASMPTPRHFLAAATVGGKVYAIGGYNMVGMAHVLATVEAFDPLASPFSLMLPLARR